MAAFKKAFSNRPFVGAVLFVVFLYVFEELLFDFPQAKFLQIASIYFTPWHRWVTFLSGIVSMMICYFFVWAALGSPRIFQVLYTFFFALSSLVQYGFWKAVGRFMSSPDLKIAAATPFDTWTGATTLYFNWYFVLPLIAFIACLLIFSKRQNLKISFIRLGSVFLLIVLLTSLYALTNQEPDLGLSLSAFSQTITRFVMDDMLPSKREIIKYHHPGVPKNNIVLVIDESIRGDHLSVNGYARDTTPLLNRLDSTEDGFHSWGLAVSGATCSYPSNALILTGVRPGIDKFEMTVNYPTVFQYAKSIGYKTYYMDAQTNSLWNGLTDQDVSFIDKWFKASDFGNDCESDFRAADMISEIVSKGAGNFIVLNKRGVHFLYESSYPSEGAVWFPLPGDYNSHPEFISNSYDNGILYNVNTFFEHLMINPRILENTTILYTSDHGQTLFENHVNWLHCNYTSQEATVPLIMIGENLPPIDHSYHASHSNILPTLLDLMGIPTDQRIHSYAPSLFSQTMDRMTDHFFFDGSLRLIDFPD